MQITVQSVIEYLHNV